MSDKPKNLLDQYGLNPPAADEIDELADQDGYQGLILYRGKKGPRFHIIDRKGHIHGCGYAYLLGWYYSPPDTLTIYTTTHRFTLMGEKMDIIEKAFLREKVLQLREFNSANDQPPLPDLPIIRRLSIFSAFDKKDAE